MQSSTAIAFRALIMLICLISVPMFAIFGKDLPDVVKGLLEGKKLVLAPSASESGKISTNSQPPAAEAENPFGKAVPYRAGPDPISPQQEGFARETTSLAGPPLGASPPAPLGTSAELPRDWRNAPSPVAQPAGFHSPPDTQPLATAEAPAGGPPDLAHVPLDTANTRLPATMSNGSTGSLADQGNAFPMASDAARPAANASRDERFRWAETRLRDLGATHYMLETWGPDNRQYRFGCKMALTGNSIATQYFEAVRDDPWQAMENVLQQVEQWQSTGPEKAVNFPAQAGF